MSIYKNFNVEYSLASNMFSQSNTEYCVAYLTSDGVNEYVEKVYDQGLIF